MTANALQRIDTPMTYALTGVCPELLYTYVLSLNTESIRLHPLLTNRPWPVSGPLLSRRSRLVLLLDGTAQKEVGLYRAGDR